MKVAVVKFGGTESKSPMLYSTDTEEIRDEDLTIEWKPHHVVFRLSDGNVVAYRATDVVSIDTYEE